MPWIEKENGFKKWIPPKCCGYCRHFIREKNVWTCFGKCGNPDGLRGRKGTFSIGCLHWVWNVGRINVEEIGEFNW